MPTLATLRFHYFISYAVIAIAHAGHHCIRQHEYIVYADINTYY